MRDINIATARLLPLNLLLPPSSCNSSQHVPACGSGQSLFFSLSGYDSWLASSPQDAQIIFHAVALGVLPMVTRRLDTEERRSITSGCVFVWEERGPSPEATGVSFH